MSLRGDTLLAILLMGIVTYALRAGGYWLMGRVAISPRMEGALAYLPGSVITALVVPSALEAGVPGVVGVGVVALVMWKRPNLLLALLASMGAVALLRTVLWGSGLAEPWGARCPPLTGLLTNAERTAMPEQPPEPIEERPAVTARCRR